VLKSQQSLVGEAPPTCSDSWHRKPTCYLHAVSPLVTLQLRPVSGGRFKVASWQYSGSFPSQEQWHFHNIGLTGYIRPLIVTPSPLSRLAISSIIRYPTVIYSPLVRCINKCNHCHSHGASCSSLCDHINDPQGSRQHGWSILAPVWNTFSTLTLLVGWQEKKLHRKLLCKSTTMTHLFLETGLTWVTQKNGKIKKQSMCVLQLFIFQVYNVAMPC